MDAVLEALEAGAGEHDAITSFNLAHEDTRDFSFFDPVEKKKFMTAMLTVGVDEHKDENLRTAALTALRYILREKAETAEVLTCERVMGLLKISGLLRPAFEIPADLEAKVNGVLNQGGAFQYPKMEEDESESCLDDEEADKAKQEVADKAQQMARSLPLLDAEVERLGGPWEVKHSAALQSEAAKCIVNVITKHERGGAIVDAFDILPSLLLRLKTRTYPKESRFANLRLLLRMTFENVLKLRLFESGVLTYLAGVLDECAEEQFDPAKAADLEECLKVIFSVSIPLGPLEGPKEPREDQFLAFKQMILVFQKLLFLPKEVKNRRIKSAVTQALINVPARCTQLFDPERTLDALIEVLFFQVDAAVADDSRAAEYLTPILLNLTSIAKAIPRARGILRSAIFPPEVFAEWESSQPTIQAHEILEKGNSLASKLMNFMTSFNMAVKHYVNSFFYIVLDEDANELVRLIGFGRAAGLLATLKLFGMDKLAEAQTGRSSSGSSGSSSGPSSSGSSS